MLYVEGVYGSLESSGQHYFATCNCKRGLFQAGWVLGDLILDSLTPSVNVPLIHLTLW